MNPGRRARSPAALLSAIVLLCSCSSSPSFPTLAVVTSSLPAGEVGSSYSQTVQATGGDGVYAWHLDSGAMPLGMHIDALTGQILGTPTEQGVFYFVVAVESGDGQTAVQYLSVETAWPPLFVVTTALPDASVDESYTTQLLAEGGDGTYVWRVSNGFLPQGLGLDANAGTIEGLPTAAGTWDFTLSVTSGDGQGASREVSLMVTGPLIALTPVIPGAYVNEPYAVQLLATGGDGGAYTWSLVDGSLPSEVALSTNGLLSGVPASSGVFEFAARVTSGARAVTVGLTLSVSTAPSSAFNLHVRFVEDDSPFLREGPSSVRPTPWTGADGGVASLVASQTVLSAVSWAVARWEEVIVGDLPDVLFPDGGQPSSQCAGTGSYIRGPVDDMLVILQVRPIDGPASALAGASFCITRTSSGFPIVGFAVLDADDVNQDPLYWRDILFHEFGHALGFTGSFFAGKGLATGIGSNDPRFNGTSAVQQYHGFGGTLPYIRLESGGGQGTASSHWDEDSFGNEIMTGFISGSGNPISAMTVGAMGDLGYQVDLGAADIYACPGVCIGRPDQGTPATAFDILIPMEPVAVAPIDSDPGDSR